MRRLVKGKKGFTLVELAIVLVIIGLLLGAILKGQGMIRNAKIKNIIHSADELRAAVYTYQDRYKALPGDDSDARTHTGDNTLNNGDGDGRIETAGSEHLHLFNHLAAAGIISGSADLTSLPSHAFGDNYYILYTTAQGKAAHWIVYENLPGDVGRTIDYTIDDGVYDSGAVRANQNYTNDNVVTLYIEF